MYSINQLICDIVTNSQLSSPACWHVWADMADVLTMLPTYTRPCFRPPTCKKAPEGSLSTHGFRETLNVHYKISNLHILIIVCLSHVVNMLAWLWPRVQPLISLRAVDEAPVCGHLVCGQWKHSAAEIHAFTPRRNSKLSTSSELLSRTAN